jgi:hypothetical protein
MAGKTHRSQDMGQTRNRSDGDAVAISVSLHPGAGVTVLEALSTWMGLYGLSVWSLHSLRGTLYFSAALRIEEPWASSYTWANSSIGPMQAPVTSLKQLLSRYGIEVRLEGGEIRNAQNDVVRALPLNND